MKRTAALLTLITIASKLVGLLREKTMGFSLASVPHLMPMSLALPSYKLFSH